MPITVYAEIICLHTHLRTCARTQACTESKRETDLYSSVFRQVISHAGIAGSTTIQDYIQWPEF